MRFLKSHPVINYTPAKVTEEITRYYYHLFNAEKKIADAVACAIVGRNNKFKNQLDRFVDVSYTNEIFIISDRYLSFERHFKIPLEVSKLGSCPTILDYLSLANCSYIEEPLLKRNIEHKKITELDEMVKVLRKDFSLTISGSLFSLKHLTRENSLLFNNNLIKVDSTIKPAIVVLRENYKKYKKVRYEITTGVINELKYL